MNTYTEARATLDEINSRIYAHKKNAPVIGKATVEEFVEHGAKRDELVREARSYGFISIFDGSFKLNKDQVNIPN